MTARELPMVEPLRVRQFSPTGTFDWFGGVLVLDTYDVVDRDLAPARLPYDEPVVDCSRRIFEITTHMMMGSFGTGALALTVFPSRRFRNFRTGQDITGTPDPDHPLLYLGNPVRLFADPGEGITVVRIPEFLIKSGPELGF